MTSHTILKGWQMEITVSKKMQVELTDEEAENLVANYLKGHYYEVEDILDAEDKKAFNLVYNYFSGKHLDWGQT